MYTGKTQFYLVYFHYFAGGLLFVRCCIVLSCKYQYNNEIIPHTIYRSKFIK